MLSTALILGFAGSLHCVGMCSPLVMAVTNAKRSIMLNKVIYNTGRIFTYGVLGLLAGSVNLIVSLSKFQHLLSIVFGVMLLTIGVTRAHRLNIPFVTNALQRITVLLKMKFKRYYPAKSHYSTFVLGSINGLLPCGLTFLAVTLCLAVDNAMHGFLFMLAFGLGTLPAMLGLPFLYNTLAFKLRLKLSRINMIVMILSGCLLVARALNAVSADAHSLKEGVDIVLCR